MAFQVVGLLDCPTALGLPALLIHCREGAGRNGVRKRESQPSLKQPTPSAHVQPSAFSTFRQTALQPCNNQNREKQEDSSTEADSTQSHTIGLHCSLTHTHSCREKKEGILTGPAWLGTQFQNLGKKQRKKKEKNVKLRETWKHILSKQYKNRVGEEKKREREGRGGGCWWEAVIQARLFL